MDPRLRTAILFAIGVTGIVWVTVVDDVDRPYLLALFAGMIGLTPYLSIMKRLYPPPGEEKM